jgi:hypothetical protein
VREKKSHPPAQSRCPSISPHGNLQQNSIRCLAGTIPRSFPHFDIRRPIAV